MDGKYCRLCIKRSKTFIDIFSEIHLSTIIAELFSIKIKENDHVSTVICLRCNHLIRKFYNYCCYIKNAQKKLYDNISKYIKNNNDLHSECLKNDGEISSDDSFRDDVKYEMDIKKETADLDHFSNDTTNNFNEKCNSDILFGKNKNNKINLPLGRSQVVIVIKKQEMDIENDTLMNEFQENNPENITLNKFEADNKKTFENILNKVSECKQPADIIQDGRIILKGQALDELHQSFYNIHCDICENLPKFPTLEMMFEHYAKEHSVMGYVKCCNRSFYKLHLINNHIVRHLQPKSAECSICQKKITSRRLLKVHLLTHLPMSERPYQCDQCDKGFLQLRPFNLHKKNHLPIEEREPQFMCPTCRKMFSSEESRNEHEKACESVKCLCTDCGRSFKSNGSLQAHIKRIHDPKGDPKMKCPMCDVVCKVSSLKIHLKSHGEKNVKCPYCDYTTHLKKTLTSHLQWKHSDNKPFACSVCSKKFKFRKVLKDHMAQHTGLRKFTCEYCPKTFTNSANCITHRNRMHAAEKIQDKKSNELTDENIQIYDPDEEKKARDKKVDAKIIRAEITKANVRKPWCINKT